MVGQKKIKMTDKRQDFLNAFLGALGANQIHWTLKTDNAIYGTAIYDPSDIDERQDFVWHMHEKDMPPDRIIDLLIHLKENELLDIDKLKKPITEIEIPNCDPQEKEKLFNELFKVTVSMIDDGQETDHYFIHG